MHKIHDQDLRLNAYGAIDIDYYISKGKHLRNQAIKQKLNQYLQAIKSAITPQPLGSQKAA